MYEYSEPKLPPVFEPHPPIPPISIHTPAPAKPVSPMAKSGPATVIKPPAMPVKPIEAPVENPHKAN
jgi:hypothetical protein